jgi:tRNA pseudouridine55 synthase
MIRWSMEQKLRRSSANSMPDKGPSHVEGLLNIDKPSDYTSHDVVAHIRRWTRVARVGHAGTLDPQATGVLLIGLGPGTKLTQFLHECPKTYRATLQLGVRTDTCDAAGKVVGVAPVREMNHGEVEAVLVDFRGPIEQIPPMFSALKQQGRRLYTLARQGIDVERQPRRVQIFRLALLEFSAATLSLEVECSSGTYIRVLADDIGTRLGCGAHLRALVRTATGPFTLAQALTLPALEDAVRQDDWRRHVIPLSAAVAGFPALILTAAAAQGLAHGVAPTPRGIARHVGTFEAADTVALLGPDEGVLAMGSVTCGAAELEDRPQSIPVVRLRRVLS